MHGTLTRASRPALVIAIAVVGAMLAACGGSNSSATTTPAASTAGASAAASLSGTITVMAASSLTDAFSKEAVAFQKAHPGARVTFNFAGSPTLVTQLDQGAPADVLATADEKNMKTAADKALVAQPARIFARNRLVIVVPRSNPGGIRSPQDLAKPGLKIVLAQTGVPVGDYARQALTKMDADASYGAGFSQKALANLVSEEANVKSVVAKVQLGEADAGIVYRTDITPGVASDVTAVDVPDAFNVIASYPIAVTKDASKPDVAAAFIEFILSAAGQQILADAGFMSAQ